MRYEIASQTFTSQAQFKTFMRKRLYPDTFNPQDPFLYALLSRHIRSAEKIGVGVDRFRLEWRPFSKTWEPVIIRKDGSSIDFSWVRCINGTWMSYDAKLRAAMRGSVVPQVLEFLRQSRDNICAICKNPRPNTHVDHVTRFEALVQTFLLENSLSKPEGFDDHPTEHRAMFKSQDESFERAWQDYHRAQAVLQLTCAKCNLKRG